jgi:beta-mannosidase
VGELRVENPQLWWPNGLGDQPLYDLHVELRDERDKLLDETDKRIGLRTLRLDRHEDEWGESFHFVVNGLAFFAKGANWIPADAVQSRMSPAWYRHLVEEAAAVHMNMLRVWGGGLYEDDSFYQACDENGICVWQDFMFACAAYPSYDEQFLQSVAAEARDNVRRLRHHPSLALWCGNNEIEQMGMVSERGWEQGEMTWNSYKHLFDEILPNIVRELHPEAAYWPSSPHSPREDRTDMNNPRWGDAHLWGVWHGQQPFEWYRTCEHRFNSEFGFQSFPEPRTVKQYTAPEDRNVTSRIMEHHQRSGVGNTRIMQYMLDWFRLPVGFENTLWTSQILQGMAMKYACEHWRRTMPRGMGTLYWQLNDTWPVASWSSIDYFGRWKALHYMAQHFYAPILVSAVEDVDAGIARLYVSNDLPVHVTGAVTWTVTDLAGNKLREDRCEFTQNATSTSEIGVAEVGDLIARYRPWGILMWLALDDGSAVKSRNLVLFARPKHLELSREPGISAQVEQADHGGVRLRLETKKPALWVWLDLGRNDARFSDNFFNLVPGVPHCVSLETDPSLSAEQIAQGIGIRSLVDTYTEKPTHGG